jgi:hypothetical protein
MLQLRMSSMGGCDRALVYEALQVKGEPRTKESELTLALGQVMEPVILKAQCYQVEDPQIELVLPVSSRGRLVGHPEGRQGNLLLEVKTMADFAWKQANRELVINYYPQYGAQNGCYFAAWGRCNASRFILFNKNTSRILEQDFTHQEIMRHARRAIKKARRVFRYVEWGTMPAKAANLKKWQCQAKYCKYHLCPHNEGFPAWTIKHTENRRAA